MHYHGHVYYRNIDKAREAHRVLAERHNALYLFPLRERAIGPHPLPSFGMAFGESLLLEVRQWMQQNQAWMDGLIHPVLANDIVAHTHYAEWIGQPVSLRMEHLAAPPTKLGELSLQHTEQQPAQLDINSFEILCCETPIGQCTMGAHYQDEHSVWRSCEIYEHQVEDAFLQQSSNLIFAYLKQFTDCKKIFMHHSVSWKGNFSLARAHDHSICVLT